MVYKIEYKSSVSHDLKQLDKQTASKILYEIDEMLSENPGVGERLHGEYLTDKQLRVGDYRVVYAKLKDRVVVLRIRHRSKAYEREA
ncbi:MAG: type II toxin-antitoxin system RelE/ParE family toxin [Thaumarchaeota archaeon]|nr:type II toxin-antitoxin system RelE/ParE family toxin [Nitrososphaerota archaeon]